ncbi:hypothetical protein M422DRAFT_26368 [Sphaerobolus stellatus SS14]|nr:hypothetical protein M422DRAFT_26368 [Sphaerobolus stellatus SS14]
MYFPGERFVSNADLPDLFRVIQCEAKSRSRIDFPALSGWIQSPISQTVGIHRFFIATNTRGSGITSQCQLDGRRRALSITRFRMVFIGRINESLLLL